MWNLLNFLRGVTDGGSSSAAERLARGLLLHSSSSRTSESLAAYCWWANSCYNTTEKHCIYRVWAKYTSVSISYILLVQSQNIFKQSGNEEVLKSTFFSTHLFQFLLEQRFSRLSIALILDIYSNGHSVAVSVSVPFIPTLWCHRCCTTETCVLSRDHLMQLWKWPTMLYNCDSHVTHIWNSHKLSTVAFALVLL